MNQLIQKFVRPELRRLSGYISARHLAKEIADEESERKTKRKMIYLDANENPFGSVLGKIAGVELSRYPDPYAESLRAKLARYVSVKPEQILIGNGSDEIIWLLLFAFVAPRDEVVVMEPSFAMYRIFAELAGARVRSIALESNYSLDAQKLLKTVNAKTKIIFLCSPNNPTGNVLPLADVEKIVRVSKKLVVVDEAYIEFAPGSSALRLLKKYPNLILLRTFSKAWGLAGLRVGYALGDKEIIQTLQKVRAPYSVDVLAASLAERALTKRKQMEMSVRKIIVERKKLEMALKKMSLKIFPSVANFVLVRFPMKWNASTIQQTLSKKFGLIVRDFNKPGLENCFRVTVGTPRENELLLTALKQVLK